MVDYPVLAKSVGLNGFPVTLLAFRDVVSDCICSLPECRSIQQSNRVDWLVSFSKTTNILRQCPLEIVFPPAPKFYAVQPIRWQHKAAAQTMSHLSAFECAPKLEHSLQHICACAALEHYSPSHPLEKLHYARETATMAVIPLSSHVFCACVTFRLYMCR